MPWKLCFFPPIFYAKSPKITLKYSKSCKRKTKSVINQITWTNVQNINKASTISKWSLKKAKQRKLLNIKHHWSFSFKIHNEVIIPPSFGKQTSELTKNVKKKVGRYKYVYIVNEIEERKGEKGADETIEKIICWCLKLSFIKTYNNCLCEMIKTIGIKWKCLFLSWYDGIIIRMMIEIDDYHR